MNNFQSTSRIALLLSYLVKWILKKNPNPGCLIFFAVGGGGAGEGVADGAIGWAGTGQAEEIKSKTRIILENINTLYGT